MAGAEEIFFIEEETRVLDELIHVSKYSNLKKALLLDTIPFPPPDVTMVCDND
jgi:hypothetical protein